MSNISLAQATRIVDHAILTGREKKLQPLAVVVLDTAGKIVVLKREDNTSLLRNDVAEAKAAACLGMGFGGRELDRRGKANPAFFASLAALAGGGFMPFPGGVLIRGDAGELLGAVGISGDTGANDELCAVAGIRAAGLVPDTGDPA